MNRVRLFGGEDPEVRVHAMNPSQVTPSVVSPFGPTGPACRVYRYTYMHSSLSTLSLSLCVYVAPEGPQRVSSFHVSQQSVLSVHSFHVLTKRPRGATHSYGNRCQIDPHTPPLRYEPHMYRRYAKNKKSGSRPALPPIRLYLLITISCSPYRETLEVTGVYGTCETPPPPSRFCTHHPR